MQHVYSKRSNRQSWPIKALAIAVVIGLTGTVTQAATVNRKPIGDLEIYAPATPGTASIFMMLDTSGSMGSGSMRNDYGQSCWTSSQSSEKIRAVIYKRQDDGSAADGLYRDEDGNTVIDKTSIQQEINFTPEGCTINGTMRFDRLTRLKIALIELLADEVFDYQNNLKDSGSLSDDYEIGFGNYSYNGRDRAGVVLVPTKALTAPQRAALINAAKDLEASGLTPTAHALAESGAYMMGTTTKGGGSDNYSGFDDSVSSSKSGNAYISPLNTQECSGNGIYLLTDGQPNGSRTTRSKNLMNESLLASTSSPALSVDSCESLTGDSSSRSWGCMASYAALLRNTANNPLGLPIKTATVGFGSDFAGLTGTRTITVDGESKEVTDCDSGSVGNDTRNLCKLGERKGDNEVKTFGDGGFYYTEESADIAASIVDFASGLVQIINTAPSGTITIPEDPYRAANQLPYAYLPMLDPSIASAASIWRGNLKKYELNKGTLFGNSSKLLYKDVAGNLDEKTQDLWQTSDFKVEGSIANNNITAGGVYAQLRTPSSSLGSVRSLYVEDYTSSGNTTPILRKLSVDSSGKPQGFDKLIDAGAYSQLNQRRLLSFLGFTSVLTNDGQPTSTTEVKNLVLTRPTNETKVLGGVVHSKPEAISYSATLDDNGRITDTRDDYVLFGSMDGALHLVDADDGKEEVAIIPRSMLIAQPEALVDGSIRDRVGEPYFGVDAPWLVTTDYNFDLPGKQVKVEEVAGEKGMFAYGGLRMGGEAFYGMNISKKAEPKMLFTITKAGLSSTTTAKSNTVGFERLGQIWNKPTSAKIRMSKDADPINVLVFGGGYDMKYEDDSYVPTASAPAKGNAIYVINAQSGELIWSTSGESGSTKNIKTDKMINSMVGGITVLDRDNDGLMDHLYAADLGGQVFRADFENARPEKYGFTEVASFSNKRVTRVLNAAPSTEAFKKYAYRFYDRPIVSFYRNEGISGQTIANNGKLFALVNVISGNRSAPLSTLRNNNDYANRVYGIIDTDITNADLYKSGFTPVTQNLTEGELVNLATTLGASPSEAQKNAAKVNMIKGSKQGWYYPLTRFDGYNNVRHNKGVGDSAVINNLLYTTVYNPDKQYGTVASCAAKISGGSERQLYCLPYGVCMDSTSVSGTGGYIPAGQGIQELTLGAYDKDNTDVKILIGTTTITDRIEAANRAGYGLDGIKNDSNIKDLYPGETSRPTQATGDGTAAEFLFNERYTLQPRAWYERK
ncbi:MULTISPECIES: PilC/PilY family type IV pilus protein [unclassified Psychrobacter]|uniref:PilC/PilY family type IV pilus protein n=1 Tax=unclassified Psychrobacter TaxID=196806 RepID=UPI000ED00573|nr:MULTISPECIES: PilC/PilY family type IV pilus protein [unclassified Psychrobacter]HCI75842.1 pilus assembly protein PilY [Psychrobacter sp.]